MEILNAIDWGSLYTVGLVLCPGVILIWAVWVKGE